MEVFLGNVPRHLTEKGLHTQLAPYMEKLAITDYVCEKPRNQEIAFAVFLLESDAFKFLANYERTTKLVVMGQPLKCNKSRKGPTQLQRKLDSARYEINKRQSQHQPPPEPPRTVFRADDLRCGSLAFLDDHQLAFINEWGSPGLACGARFSRRKLVLWRTTSESTVEAQIPYQTIVELIWWSDPSQIAVVLSSPPIFISKADTAEDIPGVRVEAFTEKHAAIAPFCLVYFIPVISTTTIGGMGGEDNFRSRINRVKDMTFLETTEYHLQSKVPGSRGCQLQRCNKSMLDLKNRLKAYTQINRLPFGILFMLQALAYNGYLHPTVIADLTKRLGDEARAGDSSDLLSDAFKQLFHQIPYPSPHQDPAYFHVDGIMKQLSDNVASLKCALDARAEILGESQSRTKVFRATVTPSRITLHGPEMEAKNRILRKYPNHIDHFLRVQFCDENGQDLFFNPKVDIETIYDRFRTVLNTGIQVAGRVYKFLGFSHSSLRARSVWFSAPFVYQNKPVFATLIIKNLGEFDEIKSPARQAARIGQAFSETPHSISLDDCQITITKIDDVKHNDRVFSDGVGTISIEAAESIWDVLPESKGFPTCFQIRCAGAKGMLSLDVTLPGKKIRFRPSMIKFKSPDMETMGICDTSSKPIPFVLNRQLIKILEDMAAPRSWFLDLQENELRRLRNITSSIPNTASFLDSLSICESMRLPQFLRFANRVGADYRSEPFLRGAVEAIVLRELRMLKHKARIPVRKGITLFGIMDEFGFLDEGEVYVTYDTLGRRHDAPPAEGPVVVTRSPALHPGDIQLADNIIPPAGHPLRELNNCVVFSSVGERDLPSQLSGGDLDGDIFNIIWDPEIVETVQTYLPADYPRVDPVVLDRNVETSDITNFFVDFMKTDRLGVIATQHMIAADFHPEGTLHPDCVKLAGLHSKAVDFSKTGIPVEMGELPPRQRARPDFLAPGPWVKIQDRSELEMDEYVYQGEGDGDDAEGPRHRYYTSKKVLGQLYRAIDERKIWMDDIKTTAAPGQDFWETFLHGVQSQIEAIGRARWEKRLDEAERIRLTYEESIIALTTDWSEHPSEPLTELEVFVGFILNRTGNQTTRQRDRSLKLKDDFDRITSSIIREFRKASTSGSPDGRLQTVELCLAGIHAGRAPSSRRDHRWSRGAGFHVKSFRVAAASALMRELNSFANERKMETMGGGFPGVQGLPVRTMTPRDILPVSVSNMPVRTVTPRDSLTVSNMPLRTMTPKDSLTVGNAQHRQQTPDAKGVENQKRAALGSGLATQMTQEALVTNDLLMLIQSRYPTQPGK
ncbi:RNA-dependent RNA polymerase 1 [Podospora conica]|nr:RNA-dependent RNA polymerase 1 [Schizothecium conicum]